MVADLPTSQRNFLPVLNPLWAPALAMSLPPLPKEDSVT